MTNEFNLSEKRWEDWDSGADDGSMDDWWIRVKDVKEFIRLLKNAAHYKDCDGCVNIMNQIDKLAGPRLSGAKLEGEE